MEEAGPNLEHVQHSNGALPRDVLAAIFAQLEPRERAATAAVCVDWAAVHRDPDSRIWEGANLQGPTQRAVLDLDLTYGDGAGGYATSLQRCLSRWGPGLKQLQLHDVDFDTLFHSAGSDHQQEQHLPRSLLAVLTREDGSALAPLEALRISGLAPSLLFLPAFSSTLRQLVMPQLPRAAALRLPAVMEHLTALEVLDTVVVDCWDAEKAGSLAGGAPGLGGPLPDGPTAPGCLRDDPEADACMAVLRAAAQWCKGLRHLALSFCDSDPMDGWEADIPEELTTLTALNAVHLNLPGCLDGAGEGGLLSLPLWAPHLRHLVLVEPTGDAPADQHRHHSLGRLTGLQALECNSLYWGSPLPSSLRCLLVSMHDQPAADEALAKLALQLRGLTALQHLSIAMDGLAPQMGPMLDSLQCCQLTYLSFSQSCLVHLAAECALPASLRVVDLAHNYDLSLDQWLPRLAALEHCHSISLLSSALTGAILVQGGLGKAPALQHLLCQAIEDLPTLEAERAKQGLPQVSVQTQADWEDWKGLWDGYRTLALFPPLHYGPCSLLPSPQLDPMPCHRA